MDGREVQRMKSLRVTADALRVENTNLSVKVLEMGAALDEVTKAHGVARLMNAILLRQLGDRLELSIDTVNGIREELSTPPGLVVDVAKIPERGVWVIELRAGVAEEVPPEPTEEPDHDGVQRIIRVM